MHSLLFCVLFAASLSRLTRIPLHFGTLLHSHEEVQRNTDRDTPSSSQHLKRKIENFLLFSGEVVTHLTFSQRKKPLSRLILAVEFLFLNRFSKFLWHF